MRKTPQHFKEQLEGVGVPAKDLVGLRVTHRAPAGFSTINGTYVCNGKVWPSDTYKGRSIVGLYVAGNTFSRKGDVHVTKRACVSCLVHEVGHHVTLTLNDQSGSIGGKLRRIIRHLKCAYLPLLGLRSNSLTNWRELLADCYEVRHCGSRKQWANLVDFFGEHDVDLVAATAAK